MFVERRAHSHLRPPTHAPLDHASLLLDAFLPPWHHAHFAMLKRFCWWIGMNVYTRWWLCHYVKCQTRKTPRLTIRWPIISMPLPEGPGVAIRVDYFGPLPVTPRGNTYILLITDRFLRRADMSLPLPLSLPLRVRPISWLTNKFPLRGCPRTILSDNGQ